MGIRAKLAPLAIVPLLGLTVACGTPANTPSPGTTLTGGKVVVGAEGELAAVYLGKVDGEELYTLCHEGDRLFFWDTWREGSMAIHINDATCPK